MKKTMANSDFTATLDHMDYARIMNALSELSAIEREAIIAKAIQEGLSYISKQGKSKLESSGIHLYNVYGGKRAGKTTHLIKSFKVITKKKQMKGYAGFSRPAGSAAHLIDRGTVVRSTKKGYNRGRVVGNYFWTNAVKQTKDKAQNELMESVRKSIEKIIKRNS